MKLGVTLTGNQRIIAKNLFWAMLGKVVSMVGTLLVGILVARYLGPDNYGLMNYVISYVAIFSVIATFGLDDIEIRELSKTPDRKDAILGTSFCLRLFFAIVGFLFVLFSLWINKTDTFTTLMILIYALSLFTGCFGIIRNYFTSIVQNEYIVKSEIARTIIGAIIKVVLLLLELPVGYFIAATLFDTILVSSGYLLSYLKKIGSLHLWKFDKTLVPYLIKESFPLLLSGSAVIIYQRIDQVMIGQMIDNTSVGYFATAGTFVGLILFLPMVLTQTITPLVIRVKQNGSREEYEKKKRQFVGSIVWISIIVALLVSLSSKWMILFTFGPQYEASIPVLRIMSWKTVGMALSAAGGQIIIIEGVQKWAVIKNIVGCLFCVGLNLLLLPSYGIVGSAWVTIITTLITGWWGNLMIPQYHSIFKLETHAFLGGWKELLYFKSLLKK